MLLGNPINLFILVTGHELVALETCDAMENVVAMSLSKITKVQSAVGKTLHSEYVDTRLTKATVPVFRTIKINRLAIVQTHEGKQIGMLKQNTTLITQRFISFQSRPEADLVDFFKYENQREKPPSFLSDCDLLEAGNKLDTGLYRSSNRKTGFL